MQRLQSTKQTLKLILLPISKTGVYGIIIGLHATSEITFIYVTTAKTWSQDFRFISSFIFGFAHYNRPFHQRNYCLFFHNCSHKTDDERKESRRIVIYCSSNSTEPFNDLKKQKVPAVGAIDRIFLCIHFMK